MDITAIAGAAVTSAFDRLDAAAVNLVSSVTPSIPVDTIDISSAAIELSQAEIQTSISIQVLKTAREIDKQTVDIFA